MAGRKLTFSLVEISFNKMILNRIILNRNIESAILNQNFIKFIKSKRKFLSQPEFDRTRPP